MDPRLYVAMFMSGAIGATARYICVEAAAGDSVNKAKAFFVAKQPDERRNKRWSQRALVSEGA